MGVSPRATDIQTVNMQTCIQLTDRQTSREKRPADMQTTFSRETDNQTAKKQRYRQQTNRQQTYRQQRSRQAHNRPWTSRQREADLLPCCLSSARLQLQGIRCADNCIPQKANKEMRSHGRRHRPQFIAEKRACRHADLQTSKQPTRRQADRRHGFESC